MRRTTFGWYARPCFARATRCSSSVGDTTANTNLLPGETSADAPTLLAPLLRHLARRSPQLQIYLLTWDYASVYAFERDVWARLRFTWRMPRNVHFAFDARHPVGGSHHQKVVVIDDELAFCGGIDLTGHRWDTCEHRVEEPLRLNASDQPYEPYHEVQAMMDGRRPRRSARSRATDGARSAGRHCRRYGRPARRCGPGM
jgi:phosphatidylserine/phosphatidylglycerophosphate/cardiolipin synthase-like enzyme